MVKKIFRMMLVAGVSFVAASEATLASGNVQVALEGSLLTVFGDNLDNSIEFKEVLNPSTQLPDITVTGLAGTLVNGLPSVTFPGAVLNATEIRMENGNDNVVVLDVNLGNDLYVSLGEGNDLLAMDGSVVGNNLAVEGGLGDDSISILGQSLPAVADVGQELYIDGGLGRLNASLTGMNVGTNLTVIGDESNDSLTINDCTAGDMLSVETKGGADSVTITSSGAFLASVNTDAGRDSLSGTNVSAGEDAIFEGGAGVDTLTNRGIRGGKIVEFKEFEIRR